MSENVEYYKNQISLARTEIRNLRQQLSALKYEHQKEIKAIQSTLNTLRCANCAEPASTTCTTNGIDQPATAEVSNCINYQPIGIIETSFQNKRGVPRQPTILNKAIGTVVIDTNVFSNPEHAFHGLEEFSHMWILFHFHETCSNSSVPAKVSPPRLHGERRGVFSTRSPHRPCPVGLSLVKIQKIEGNKIQFLGVDMVNNTPVLDIKPYIPQYDYPNAELVADAAMVARPVTEGTSDAADAVRALQIDQSRLSPRLTVPLGIDTSSPRSPFEDVPSPDAAANLTPISPSPDSPSTDGQFTQSPVRRPDSERGAPDGQERFTPPQSAHLTSVNHDGIRVAPWIANPPAQTYEVSFTNDALARLYELIGDRTQAFKSNIETLLSEDPRSHYVRTRYSDHEYSCVLEDVSISCVFDLNRLACTIVSVRSAEDMQN